MTVDSRPNPHLIICGMKPRDSSQLLRCEEVASGDQCISYLELTISVRNGDFVVRPGFKEWVSMPLSIASRHSTSTQGSPTAVTNRLPLISGIAVAEAASEELVSRYRSVYAPPHYFAGGERLALRKASGTAAGCDAPRPCANSGSHLGLLVKGLIVADVVRCGLTPDASTGALWTSLQKGTCHPTSPRNMAAVCTSRP